MSTLTTREVMYMINDIEHTVAACKKVISDKEDMKMSENMKKIETGTVAEVFAMIDDDNLMLYNEEMVAACKKVVNDEGFMDTLEHEHPDSYLALIMSVILMRSCG